MFRIIPFAAAIATACVISGAAAAPAAKPTDPQIAHIVYTADNLDIENAKQALDKRKNEQVRNFAQRMIGDHTSVNDQALALVKKTSTPSVGLAAVGLIKSYQQIARSGRNLFTLAPI